MPRYGAKTYGRGVRKEGSDNFDDLWNKSKTSTRPVTRLSPAKRPANSQVQTTTRQTRSSPSKPSRMASSESSRPTRQNTVLREEVVGVTSPKRRRRASSTDDPFSFSSDDDKSPVKRMTTDKNNSSDSNNSANCRQTRASLQFDNGVESRNSSRAAPKSAHATRSSAKEKSPNNQTLITQFAKNSKSNDSSSDRKDNTDVNMDSLDDSLGSPNGSDFSSSQTSVVSLSSGSQFSTSSSLAGNVRQGRRTAGKLETVAESTSTDGSSSQLSSGSASSLRGKTRALNSASQSSNSQTSSRNLRTNPSGSSQDFEMKSDDSDSDDSEVIIVSSTSIGRSRSSQESTQATSSQASSSQSSSLSGTSSKVAASKPSLKTTKSLPPAKPSSSSAYDEFDFSEDDEQAETPALRKVKSAGSVDNVKKIFNSPKKSPAKAKYNARSWNKPDIPEEDEFSSSSAPSSSQGSLPSKPAPFRNEGKSRSSGLTRQTVYPKKVNHSMVTSLKCKREEKKLYTVVRHVKGASDCQESGESQQYADDIEYLMEGLKGTENVGTRCLSTMGFVEKCSMPPFRMHMRAHGTIAKVFGTLQDAAQDPCLGLCTAGLMYMLSRDRLNMDLDRDSLWLLVRLLSKDTAHRIMQLESSQQAEYKRVQEKLWAVFSELPKASNTLGDIEASDLSNGHLAMESLLSLTSKRAGEWFKEELRLAGGLEHIAQTVISAALSLSPVTGRMEGENLVLFKTMNRCLRVLENVTFMNNENQQYLLELKGCGLVKAVGKALLMCENQLELCGEPEVQVVKKLDSYGLHAILHQGLLATLRLLLNISHDNEWGSMKVGEQEGLMATTLQCVLQMPQFICKDQRFDVLVLSLGLLINLVEHSPANTRKLISMKTQRSFDSQSQSSQESSSSDGASEPEVVTSLEALVQLFLQRQQAALKAESQSEEEMMGEEPEEWSVAHSDPLDWITIERDTGKGDQNGPQPTEEEIKSSVRKALHSAGKHMEDSIVASYTALLLGCLLRENNLNVASVRDCLPDGDFTCMVDMLKKFLSFIELTNAAGNTGSKSISKVIEVLECF